MLQFERNRVRVNALHLTTDGSARRRKNTTALPVGEAVVHPHPGRARAEDLLERVHSEITTMRRMRKTPRAVLASEGTLRPYVLAPTTFITVGAMDIRTRWLRQPMQTSRRGLETYTRRLSPFKIGMGSIAQFSGRKLKLYARPR